MIGAKKDVMGYIPSQMSAADAPGNRFLNDPLLLKPILGASLRHNRRERLISQRYTSYAMATTPQGQYVRVRRENEKMVPPGGLAEVPNAGLWGRLFG